MFKRWALINIVLGHHQLQLNGHFGLDEVRVLIYVKKKVSLTRINNKLRHILFPIYNFYLYLVKHLSLLLELFKPSCQIIKINVVRRSCVSTNRSCGECVRN